MGIDGFLVKEMFRFPGDQPECNLEEVRETTKLARRVRDAIRDFLKGNT
ncbi:MAG: hypothetical protein ABIK83_04170 [Candidatus Zixiibacteriota bacterium]